MNVFLTNPTGRKTECHVLEMNEDRYFFSYQTCIGFSGIREVPQADGTTDRRYVAVRVRNNWGPTTGRHFNESGCGGFQVVDDDTFDRILDGDPQAIASVAQ